MMSEGRVKCGTNAIGVGKMLENHHANAHFLFFSFLLLHIRTF